MQITAFACIFEIAVNRIAFDIEFWIISTLTNDPICIWKLKSKYKRRNWLHQKRPARSSARTTAVHLLVVSIVIPSECECKLEKRFCYSKPDRVLANGSNPRPASIVVKALCVVCGAVDDNGICMNSSECLLFEVKRICRQRNDARKCVWDSIRDDWNPMSGTYAHKLWRNR